MTSIFEDLKAGLTDVDHFLAGQRTGFKANIPAAIDVKNIPSDSI